MKNLKGNMKGHEGGAVVKGRTRDFSDLSNRVIGSAIEVHRTLGPGLLESTYQRCLAHDLRLNHLHVDTEVPVAIRYKGLALDCAFRIDLLVENEVIVEVKSVASIADVHQKQVLTYMRLKGIRTGFLLNFAHPRLMDGLMSFTL